MRISLLIVVYFFFQSFSICQSNFLIATDSSKTKKTFFSIEINPFLSSKIKYDNKGEDIAKSKHLLSGEVGIGFSRQLDDNWYWQSSLNIGLIPFNFNYEIEAPENSIFQTGPYKDDYKILDFNWTEYSYVRMYSSLDFLLSRKILTFKNNAEFLLGAGARLFAFFVDNYGITYSHSYYIDENNTDVKLFYADIDDTTSNRFSLSFLFEATYLKMLRNNHKIKTSIFFNYSPFKSVEGRYFFTNLGYQSSGTFSQNLTYLGLRLNYFIPMRSARKKLNLQYFNKESEQP